MAIIKWDPWREFQNIQDEMSRVFERAFGPIKTPKIARWTPAIDMYDKDDSIVIKAELPGIKPNEVELSIVDNSLKIKGERKYGEEVREENYYRMEQHYGSFERVIPLPTEVKVEEVKATYHDGILDIVLPKIETKKPKEIKVKIEEK
jgi:HSP20 family protein